MVEMLPDFETTGGGPQDVVMEEIHDVPSENFQLVTDDLQFK